MALKDTCKVMKTLLEGIKDDLEKAETGNKAAAQRVRTSTIKFEKIAKGYRKESIKADKSGLMSKAKQAARKKSPPKKGSSSLAQPSAPSSAKKSTPTAKKTSGQAKRAPAKRPTAAKKRATAKLPKRKKK